MLAAVGALIRAHQRKGFLGDGAHLRHIGWVFHVQDRPHVQATDRGVSIPRALGAVLFEYIIQTFRVVGQVVEVDGAVLDKRDRFCRPPSSTS